MNNLLLQQCDETGTSDCRHPLGVIGIFGLDDLAANSYRAHDVNSIEYLCDNENNGTIGKQKCPILKIYKQINLTSGLVYEANPCSRTKQPKMALCSAPSLRRRVGDPKPIFSSIWRFNWNVQTANWAKRLSLPLQSIHRHPKSSWLDMHFNILQLYSNIKQHHIIITSESYSNLSHIWQSHPFSQHLPKCFSPTTVATGITSSTTGTIAKARPWRLMGSSAQILCHAKHRTGDGLGPSHHLFHLLTHLCWNRRMDKLV